MTLRKLFDEYREDEKMSVVFHELRDAKAAFHYLMESTTGLVYQDSDYGQEMTKSAALHLIEEYDGYNVMQLNFLIKEPDNEYVLWLETYTADGGAGSVEIISLFEDQGKE